MSKNITKIVITGGPCAGKSTAMSWGVGARLDFGLLLVRVDLGIKGYDPASQRWLKPAEWFGRNGYTVHLGIGYPF